MRRIYLDHTATTPLDPLAFEAMRPYFAETFGNASSVHWQGQQAKVALERSRETIARILGAMPGEMVFTSGGTESDNYAILGAAAAGRRKGRSHVITTNAEHHAVLEPCAFLRNHGFDVTILPVNEYGSVTVEQVERAATDRTCLVSIMHANNEVGTISPIREIARVVHERGGLMHSDAVQSVGKIPVNVNDLDIDLLTVSAHKTYGPKGIGGLYVRTGTEIDPLLHGGGQERNRRPGTENVPLAVGFASAVEHCVKEMAVESARLRELRDSLEERLRREIPGVVINGHPVQRLPHVLNVSFRSETTALEGDMLLLNMDLKGIAVTSGSACTSGTMQPSHVLLAMGRDQKTAQATLRFAFGRDNRKEDVDEVVEALDEIIQRMIA